MSLTLTFILQAWVGLVSAAPAADFDQHTGHHNHHNALPDLPILGNGPQSNNFQFLEPGNYLEQTALSTDSYGAQYDSYGAPAAPVIGYDSYGAPAAPPVSDEYGAPDSGYAPPQANYEPPAPAYDEPLADLPLDHANEPFRGFSNFLQPNPQQEWYGTNIDTARASGQRPRSAQHLTPPQPGRPPRRQLRPRIDKKPKGILEEMNSTLQKLGRQAHSWNVSMLNKISNLFL